MSNITMVKKFETASFDVGGKIKEVRKVATHNGVFHADEVMAVAVISLACNSNVELHVVRTRDQLALSLTDYVLDVGGQYDPSQGHYDHHQRDFKLTRENGQPYATAGLIWRDLGQPAIAEITTEFDQVQAVINAIDVEIMEKIDAVDCGVDGVNSPISEIISSFVPSWYEEGDYDMAFLKAVEVATTFLRNSIKRVYGTLLAAKVVMEADRSAGGKILILDRFCPWQETVIVDEHFSELEFVVFPDPTGSWRIQTVPLSMEGFKSRKDLPETWAGLRDSDLADLTGVADVVFCHRGRFIAGAKSREGILRLGELAVA